MLPPPEEPAEKLSWTMIPNPDEELLAPSDSPNQGYHNQGRSDFWKLPEGQ